jgi:hypothetical protein
MKRRVKEESNKYGVPHDADLSPFQGVELTMICLGIFQVQFSFHPDPGNPGRMPLGITER